MTSIIIALLFVAIAGIFDAAQTAKRDLGTSSPLYAWMTTEKLKEWYRGDGGNARWNPSFPSIPFLGLWYADFWHTMKFGWIASYACAVATLGCSFFDGWHAVIAWLVIAWLAYGIEGNLFRIGYGILFRSEPKPTLWQMLKDWNPFINTHK